MSVYERNFCACCKSYTFHENGQCVHKDCGGKQDVVSVEARIGSAMDNLMRLAEDALNTGMISDAEFKSYVMDLRWVRIGMEKHLGGVA